MNSYFVLTCTGKIWEELHTDVHALKEEVDDCLSWDSVFAIYDSRAEAEAQLARWPSKELTNEHN
jgi:hypothetical protein